MWHDPAITWNSDIIVVKEMEPELIMVAPSRLFVQKLVDKDLGACASTEYSTILVMGEDN